MFVIQVDYWSKNNKPKTTKLYFPQQIRASTQLRRINTLTIKENITIELIQNFELKRTFDSIRFS